MWWRWDGWPTAAEWQAWWAFGGVLVAAVLLYVAWKQLGGLAESNRELKRSNELLTASNKEISRPVVIIEYALERHAQRDYSNSSGDSTVYVVVRNVGASPARDVRLTGSPAFQRAGGRVTQDSIDALNDLFSGARPIKMLTPGQELKYAFDDARAALSNAAVPAEYTVAAIYTDLQRTESYADEFVLELSPWGPSVAEVAPMKRLSKDIQFVAQSLRDRSQGLPGIVATIEDLKPAPPAPTRPRIPGRPTVSGRALHRRR
ncbi:hypothetical protein [Microbacterium sp.]|uniref:hypothetical protein n=1 Tax=Microbacterium sp. TaxID=51671 RepID=UPI0028AEDEEE|nr:hypothetical protein [Microbacterium sp.]